MYTLFIPIILSLFLISHVKGDSSLVSAIAQAARQMFVTGTFGFDILVYGKETSKLEWIANELGKSIKIPHRHKTIETEFLKSKIDRPGILLFKSWGDYLRHAYDSDLETKYRQSLYYLVYVDVQNKTFLDTENRKLHNIARFFHDYFFDFHGNSIILSTFETFQPQNCIEGYRKIVNEFSLANQKWKHKQFSMEKFRNLNQCEININIMYPQNLAAQVEFEGIKWKVRGYLTKFNEILSKKLNFRYILKPVEIYFTVTETSSFGYYYSFKDFAFLQYEMSSFRRISQNDHFDTIYTVTKGFTKVEEVILISRFQPYTIQEKVLLPFEAEVWYWIIGSLIFIALISFLVLMVSPLYLKNFVFGTKVNSPMMNLIYILLGGGLVTLPGRNFARFNLMMYILFCFIVRTAYQGIQFNMMIEEMRPKDIKSIDDLWKKNFTIYGYYPMVKFMNKTPQSPLMSEFGNRFKVISESASIVELLSDGSNNAFITDTEYLSFMEKSLNGSHRFIKLKEIVLSDYLGLKLLNSDGFFNILNRVITNLLESGISEWIVRNEASIQYQTAHTEPVVLTFYHLAIWFYFLAFLLLLAFTVFVLEFFVGNVFLTRSTILLNHLNL